MKSTFVGRCRCCPSSGNEANRKDRRVMRE